MKKIRIFTATVIATVSVATAPTISALETSKYTLKAGHSTLQEWLLPDDIPGHTEHSAEKIELGKQLFFDPRLSRDGSISCASCHNPVFGWSDGLDTSVGFKGEKLRRASPTIINTAYNSIQMWDGRKTSLQDQALGPMEAKNEMHTDFEATIILLNATPGYKQTFEKVYPNKVISKELIADAIAAFESTITSTNSRFDQWVKGDKKALSKDEVAGFEIFLNPDKGNCEVCHSAPNFTDNGFHNIGLQSFSVESPDLGRFEIIPLPTMKGAFKTPTLREIKQTAPYFHDGSASTLKESIEHYTNQDLNKTNLSPNMKIVNLTQEEIRLLTLFLESLSEEEIAFTLPVLPK